MSIPTRKIPKRAVLISLMLAAACAVPAVQAATAKPEKKTASTSVRFIDAPSSESPAAREKRLRRECQGRANAGACLGYTR